MMATNVLKIDTNATGLRLAEETSIGVLPATPSWLPFQPNSYGDTGSEVETVASEPINPDRMEDKGTAVRKSVTAAFQTDYRRREQWRLLQGFCFADFIEKSGNYGQADTEDVTATVTANTFDDVGSGLDALWQVGNLCLSEGFLNSANNGLSRVTAVGVADEITVTGLTLATETGPSGDAGGENGARLWNVGVEGVADDLEIDASGSRPILRSAGGIDWTTMGLTVGEWVSIGGDTSGAGGNQFPGNATNNTQARIYSISATDLTLDATDATMVTENPVGSETIQVFWCPRILKNRTSANIVRRTYTAEQRLGVPDTAAPTLVQYARRRASRSAPRTSSASTTASSERRTRSSLRRRRPGATVPRSWPRTSTTPPRTSSGSSSTSTTPPTRTRPRSSSTGRSGRSRSTTTRARTRPRESSARST
jgi:hypothetical protein